MFKVFAHSENDTIRPKVLTIKGRNVRLSKTCGGVLDTSFEELCNQVTIDMAINIIVVDVLIT